MNHDGPVIATALKSWNLVNGRFTKAIAARSDEELQQTVAPGRNRVFYLLGHLTAIHDRMLPLLAVGERHYAALDETYITNPDGSRPDPLPPAALRQAWTGTNARLSEALERLSPEEWLSKHADVSEEDFSKDPTRNRLAILLSRTGHVAFHTGQLVLIK